MVWLSAVDGSASSDMYGKGANRFTLLSNIPFAVLIVVVRITPSDLDDSSKRPLHRRHVIFFDEDQRSLLDRMLTARPPAYGQLI